MILKKAKNTWYTLVAYRNTAKRIKKYVEKGDLIDIEGKTQNRNYENREGLNDM